MFLNEAQIGTALNQLWSGTSLLIAISAIVVRIRHQETLTTLSRRALEGIALHEAMGAAHRIYWSLGIVTRERAGELPHAQWAYDGREWLSLIVVPMVLGAYLAARPIMRGQVEAVDIVLIGLCLSLWVGAGVWLS